MPASDLIQEYSNNVKKAEDLIFYQECIPYSPY